MDSGKCPRYRHQVSGFAGTPRREAGPPAGGIAHLCDYRGRPRRSRPPCPRPPFSSTRISTVLLIRTALGGARDARRAARGALSTRAGTSSASGCWCTSGCSCCGSRSSRPTRSWGGTRSGSSSPSPARSSTSCRAGSSGPGCASCWGSSAARSSRCRRRVAGASTWSPSSTSSRSCCCGPCRARAARPGDSGPPVVLFAQWVLPLSLAAARVPSLRLERRRSRGRCSTSSTRCSSSSWWSCWWWDRSRSWATRGASTIRPPCSR